MRFYYIISLFLLLSLVFSAGDYAIILRLGSSSYYPETIYPGDEFSINVILNNVSSTLNAEEVSVKALPFSNDFVFVKQSDFVNQIFYEQTGTFSLRLKSLKEAAPGYYSVPLIISYKRSDNKEVFEIKDQIVIKLNSYNKINLIANDFPKNIVYLGDSFYISGKISNESSTSLKSINLIADSNNEVIFLNDSSTFLGDLAPFSEKDFNLAMRIPENAEPGIYTISLKAKDALGNEDSEKIVFVVADKVALDISAIEVDKETIKKGDSFSLSIQFENISKSKINSLEVRIDGNDFRGSKKSFLGSLDAEDSSSAIFDLKALKPGRNKIKIFYSYEDEFSNKYESFTEYEIFVENKNSYWYLYIILVLAITLGYYFWRKRSVKYVAS